MKYSEIEQEFIVKNFVIEFSKNGELAFLGISYEQLIEIDKICENGLNNPYFEANKEYIDQINTIKPVLKKVIDLAKRNVQKYMHSIMLAKICHTVCESDLGIIMQKRFGFIPAIESDPRFEHREIAFLYYYMPEAFPYKIEDPDFKLILKTEGKWGESAYKSFLEEYKKLLEEKTGKINDLNNLENITWDHTVKNKMKILKNKRKLLNEFIGLYDKFLPILSELKASKFLEAEKHSILLKKLYQHYESNFDF